MKSVAIRQGRDLFPVLSETEPQAVDNLERVALVTADYIGLKASPVVQLGDRVELGSVVAHDRRDPDIRFCAPASGRISGIHFGPRRHLLSIEVERDGKDAETASQSLRLANEPGEVRRMLLQTGYWPALRRRPFDTMPRSKESCPLLFITATDTEPLTHRPSGTLRRHWPAFVTGIEALSKLADQTFLCVENANLELPKIDNLTPVCFTGPHPAGLVGTHITALAPNASKAWHIGYQDVIAFGQLCMTGQRWARREVSLTEGTCGTSRLIDTPFGTCLTSLTPKGRSVISGSLLSGRSTSPATAFLGPFHHQVSTIPEPCIRPGLFARLFPKVCSPQFNFAPHAQPVCGMLPLELFNPVWPHPFQAAVLLRALVSTDTELSARLGASLLAEEDMALCSYVCPSREDYARALRNTLTAIEEGF
jgi:Na+-transporting NADH:ubiquinone oxidoreductase subunit A